MYFFYFADMQLTPTPTIKRDEVKPSGLCLLVAKGNAEQLVSIGNVTMVLKF